MNSSLEMPAGDIPYLKVADMTIDGNEDVITTSSGSVLISVFEAWSSTTFPPKVLQKVGNSDIS